MDYLLKLLILLQIFIKVINADCDMSTCVMNYARVLPKTQEQEEDFRVNRCAYLQTFKICLIAYSNSECTGNQLFNEYEEYVAKTLNEFNCQQADETQPQPTTTTQTIETDTIECTDCNVEYRPANGKSSSNDSSSEQQEMSTITSLPYTSEHLKASEVVIENDDFIEHIVYHTHHEQKGCVISPELRYCSFSSIRNQHYLLANKLYEISNAINENDLTKWIKLLENEYLTIEVKYDSKEYRIKLLFRKSECVPDSYSYDVSFNDLKMSKNVDLFNVYLVNDNGVSIDIAILQVKILIKNTFDGKYLTSIEYPHDIRVKNSEKSNNGLVYTGLCATHITHQKLFVKQLEKDTLDEINDYNLRQKNCLSVIEEEDNSEMQDVCDASTFFEQLIFRQKLDHGHVDENDAIKLCKSIARCYSTAASRVKNYNNNFNNNSIKNQKNNIYLIIIFNLISCYAILKLYI